ncbi:hypothetical protein B0H19DRAFT_1074890 [Mycena capillaripes]|nr:hypothetical protein B0H19DRAFT_1074890 [Mycena capillaripes]
MSLPLPSAPSTRVSCITSSQPVYDYQQLQWGVVMDRIVRDVPALERSEYTRPHFCMDRTVFCLGGRLELVPAVFVLKALGGGLENPKALAKPKALTQWRRQGLGLVFPRISGHNKMRKFHPSLGTIFVV